MITINEVWHSQDEETWRLALDRYWSYVKPANRELEEELEPAHPNQLRQEVEKLSTQEWFDWLYQKYFRWKYTAPNRLATTRNMLQKKVAVNGLTSLYQVKERLFAFDPEDATRGLEIATQIPGLGLAGASGLLALLFPKYYGTVDQFAVKALWDIQDLLEAEALRKIKNPEGLNLGESVLLIEIMKRKAEELNRTFGTNTWTPRKVDKVLWTYGRNEG